jgi:hypothetical protein
MVERYLPDGKVAPPTFPAATFTGVVPVALDSLMPWAAQSADHVLDPSKAAVVPQAEAVVPALARRVERPEQAGHPTPRSPPRPMWGLTEWNVQHGRVAIPEPGDVF